MRQAVFWVTPMLSASRTDETPLSDCIYSHIAASHLLSGGLVACIGVFVVAVNWLRHSWSWHWYSPWRPFLPLSRPRSEIDRRQPQNGQIRPVGQIGLWVKT
jgi:hypothetical protein